MYWFLSKEEQEKQLNLHVFHTWKSAFNSRDIDKMVSVLTDNIKINSISFGDYKGKKGAREYWQKLFDTFPDIELKVITMTADENRIVTEIGFSETQKRQIYSSPGLNKKFYLHGAFVYEFTDGKIVEIRMYYDSSVLKKQLKIMEL
jgi:steroid delta-isomerase-like uncharacterized protein